MWATGNSRKTSRVQWGRGNMDDLKFLNTHTRTHTHILPVLFSLTSKTGKCGQFKMSYADVWSSRMGERWAIWNVVRRCMIKQNGGNVGNLKYLQTQTERQTHIHIYITHLYKKTSCVSFLGCLRFPCAHVFKASQKKCTSICTVYIFFVFLHVGESPRVLVFVGTFRVSYISPLFVCVRMWISLCPHFPLRGKCGQSEIHIRTHAHEERGDVGNSKCSNKNKHTRRLTYVQEDRENVDSTNARALFFWLLVDCWQCGDLLKTGSRSRTDVLYKFLEANFTE